jgi:cyanophycin synthetase
MAVPPWLTWLVEGLLRLQLSAGWQLHDAAVLERWQRLPAQAGGVQAVVLVPSPLPQVLRGLLPVVLQSLNQQLRAPAEPAAADHDAWLKALTRWAPGGNNNRYILQAAALRGIPVLALPGGVFQLGWGRRSRLFKSTLTDETSAVATAWARDKAATHALLHMAGLPVPAQQPVTSLDVALKAAERIGYPVVLKPVDLDQGLGVEADLRDEADLRTAYQRAVRHGRPLVLEKHVPGEDYRVYVVHGELLGVAHRQPAQVSGDGVSSVAALVQAENARRQAGASRVGSQNGACSRCCYLRRICMCMPTLFLLLYWQAQLGDASQCLC